MYFYKIILPLPSSCLYTYKSPSLITPGSIVDINIKNKQTLGIIAEIDNVNNCNNAKIINCHTGLALDRSLLQWILKFSEYNLVPAGILCRNILLPYALQKPKNAFYKNIYTNKIHPVSDILNKIPLRSFNKQIHSLLMPIVDEPSIQDMFDVNHIFLSDQQMTAYNNIKNSTKVSVLAGATGSGKTYVYLKIAMDMIKQGQVLLLLPEVELTQELANRICKLFDIKPMIWNHKTHNHAKTAIWHWAIQKTKGIVIGSRSALFIPFNNLKCIIVDEEHDISYKQEDRFSYHAVHMSVLRCHYAGAKCILVSATPSLEAIHNAKVGKYTYTELIKNIPVRHIYGKLQGNTWLSSELNQEIKQTLQRKEQVLLFINRRGFATKVLCLECYQYLCCDYCSAHVVFHEDKSIRCPICQFRKTLTYCPKCKGYRWKLYGIGVEKIVSELQILFPDAVSKIFSSDTKNLQKQIQEIHDHKIDIIIATQVLTKGYDFSNITCVGIIQTTDTITSLDPRYNEKTYQMLIQVRGRCGRNDKQGTIVIQGENRNRFIEYFLNNDQKSWIDHELAIRHKFHLPPFTRLIKITIISRTNNIGFIWAQDVYNSIKKNVSCQIYPPSRAYTFKVSNRFRYYIFLKSSKSLILQKQISSLIQKIKQNRDCKIKIDVDPYAFD